MSTKDGLMSMANLLDIFQDMENPRNTLFQHLHVQKEHINWVHWWREGDVVTTYRLNKEIQILIYRWRILSS